MPITVPLPDGSTVVDSNLDLNRKLTTEFIKENPTTLLLANNARTPDGAGGWTTTPTDRDPQVVRIVQQRHALSVERLTTSGESVRPEIALIMEHDGVIARGDSFTLNGLRMEVVWVNDLKYELMAEAAARG